MRNLILAVALGAVGLTAVPAEAQRYGDQGPSSREYRQDGRDYRQDGRDYRQDGRDYRHDGRSYGRSDPRQDCRRAMRHADNRWEQRRAREICQRARYSHGNRGYDDHRNYR
jgi:hypothetical protein